MTANETFSIAGISLDSRLLLAPMAGYADTIFRTAVRGLGGVGLAYTEMINPRSVLRGGGKKLDAILAEAPGDSPLCHQIYGSDAGEMIEAAQRLVERGAKIIDINMGCPQRKIAGRGSGAGLLKDPDKAVALAAAVVSRAGAPVTVKIRLGVSRNILGETRLVRRFEDAGVAAVTIHARTLKQGFSGKADWDAIMDAAAAAAGIPIIGNGDVSRPEDVLAMLRQTGCAAVMIGRAALKNPWIFRDAAMLLAGRQPPQPPSPRERSDFLVEHLEKTIAAFGEKTGVVLFRKWIPQHAAAMGMDRPAMVNLLRATAAAEVFAGLKNTQY